MSRAMLIGLLTANLRKVQIVFWIASTYFIVDGDGNQSELIHKYAPKTRSIKTRPLKLAVSLITLIVICTIVSGDVILVRSACNILYIWQREVW